MLVVANTFGLPDDIDDHVVKDDKVRAGLYAADADAIASKMPLELGLALLAAVVAVADNGAEGELGLVGGLEVVANLVYSAAPVVYSVHAFAHGVHLKTWAYGCTGGPLAASMSRARR